MPSLSPAALYELLDELLTYSAQVLDTIPAFPETAGLDGAPDLRYIVAGLPAIDCCPAMWVYAGPLLEGNTSPQRTALDPGHRSGSYPRINLPGLNLLVMRCTPAFGSENGEPPTSDQLAAVAAQVYADGWALWIELSRAIKASLLFSRCKEAFMVSGIPQDPSGGCAGWLMNMSVALDGFTSVLPGQES